MAITPNTNFVSGAVLTAQQQNNFPRGLMNYSAKLTNTTLTTGLSDVTDVVTITAETGRLYKISWVVSGLKNTSSGYIEIVAATSANVQVQAIDTEVGAGEFFNLSGFTIVSPSTGSIGYKLRGLVENDTATLTGSATVPLYLVIEDIGHI